MIGQRISHYRILEKLGAGGMGVVYKAEDPRLNRAVALKFLPENLAHDPQALERFRREAHAASALNHPNICTIYDVGEQDGLPFIAMEFIEGETLRQYIGGRPLSIERILDLCVQIADALDAAHSEGIIHRDIKPGNIFVTKRGQAKVLDFGLAKLVPKGIGTASSNAPQGISQEPTSIVGVISGTPSYMSPEQVRGDDLDTRTDLFALGLIAYEMATGRQAFAGKSGGAIIEAILTRSPAPVMSLNPELPPKLEEIINKLLEKDRDQRYQSASAVLEDLRLLRREFETGHTVTVSMAQPAASKSLRPYARIAMAGGALLVVALAVGGRLYTARRAHALTEADTVVLADFANKTGDSVFDDTLQQGLAVELEQSPFLSLVSEGRVRQTLGLMGQSPDAKLTPNIARDVCQRTGGKVYLSGSITNLGSQYVIGLNAVNCATGDSLVKEQVEAESKEKVLGALGRAASKMRGKLGESLNSVEKRDTPVEEATTPSIDALQSYTLARKTMTEKADFNAAIPLFQRAISLDPNFAMAYASLGTVYSNLGEKSLSAENTKKAYDMRARVSEREKFYIESHYAHFVTGDLEKARQVYELWTQTYPRDLVPKTNLGIIYQSLGQHEKALGEFREALALSPADGLDYSNLVITYIQLNRLNDAKAAAKEAQAKNLDSPDLRLYVYDLAFLENDAAKMAEQVQEAAGKRSEGSTLLYFAADTAAFSGQLEKARELSRQAVASAVHDDQKERAGAFESAVAMHEALFGNTEEARRHAASALALSNSREVMSSAALALAFAGDSSGAEALATDMATLFPNDTIVLFDYLPAIRAQIALNRKNSAYAIQQLQPALPYELGVPGTTFLTSLLPVYVRGQAYLASGQGAQAAAEFQKIIDSRGIALNDPIGSLAHLGLARSFALQSDVSKARASYDQFFKLWKDADLNIPVLQQARGEFEKLSEGQQN